MSLVWDYEKRVPVSREKRGHLLAYVITTDELNQKTGSVWKSGQGGFSGISSGHPTEGGGLAGLKQLGEGRLKKTQTRQDGRLGMRRER